MSSLNLQEHFLALCLCAGAPDCGGTGSPPPHPEQSEVSPSVINPPGRQQNKTKEIN